MGNEPGGLSSSRSNARFCHGPRECTPQDGTRFVKRVIGLPGDTVELRYEQTRRSPADVLK